MNEPGENIDALLAEYEANVALWQHDDLLRQQRNGNFLTVNTVLLAAIGALSAFKVEPLHLALIASVFGIFGIVVCRVWYIVQVRNSEYVRFRRYQLRSIESRIEGLTTFKHTFAAFYNAKEISFPEIKEKFRVDSRASKRSTLSEGMLPIVVAILWAIIAFGALAFAWYESCHVKSNVAFFLDHIA
jgi:hypothetical protein